MAEYGKPDLLVDSQWLAQHIDDPDLRIIDGRPAARYSGGHIKNAINIPVARLDDPNHPVRSMPLPAERISALLGGLGIANDDTIVIYDDQGSLMASRIFWVLDYYGHSKLAILNGGILQWLLDRGPNTTDVPQHPPKDYRATANASKIATKSDVQERLGSADAFLLDVRSAAEYSGQMVQAARGGHIPGAVNVEWERSLTTGAVPAIKPAAELSQMYDSAGAVSDKEIITYCQGGVRAAHTYFALRLLGYDRVRNYTGSWGEWGNDPSLPVES